MINGWHFQNYYREELIGFYTIGASILYPQDGKNPRHLISSAVQLIPE